MSTLTVTVKQRTSKGEAALEGSFQLPGSTVTKLAKRDGCTRFPNRTTLNQTARRVAAALGWELQYAEPAQKAAKKSVRRTTAEKASAPQ